VQTCSRCSHESPDSEITCPNCQADLRELSKTAVALKRFQENPRVLAVQLIVHADACPACQQMQGFYDKNQAPQLPIEGCSHEHGCRCFYQPVLEEVYP